MGSFGPRETDGVRLIEARMASTGDGNASASSPAIQREDDVSESEKARRFPGAASPHGSGPAEGSGATDEARRTLDRVARESDTLGASSLRRMGNHFSGRDALVAEVAERGFDQLAQRLAWALRRSERFSRCRFHYCVPH